MRNKRKKQANPLVRHPFKNVELPADLDFKLVGGKPGRFYTISTIARYMGIASNTLHERCIEGKLKYIFQPGYAKQMKLVHEDELRRYLGQF